MLKIPRPTAESCTGVVMGPMPTGTDGDPAALMSAARAAVLDQLAAVGSPSTVAELAAASGQHPNTVREHLDALAEAGLVARTRGLASRRGRPPNCYRALPAEQARPAVREYAGLAAALAAQIARISPAPRADAIEAGMAWGRDLAGAHQAATTTPPDGRRGPAARRQVVQIMTELGFAPEPDARGAVMRLRRCPLLEAARQHPEVVCGVHLGLVRGALEALGGDAERTDLAPFAEPGACRLELLTPRPPETAGSAARRRA